MTATLPLLKGVSPEALAPAGTPMQTWLHVVSHTDPRYGGLSSAVPALAASIAEVAPVRSALAAFCLPGETHAPDAMRVDRTTFWPTSRVSWAVNRQFKHDFVERVREADGLHIHGLWEQSTDMGASTARSLGKPYVLSAHGMLEPWALRNKRLKKQIYASLIERRNVTGATCLHALTSAEAAQYRKFGASCPIATIPNAVEVPKNVEADLFLDRFPELCGKRLVLFLSRLHPKKGLDLLLESWAQVCGDHPEAHLVIAGPDSEGTLARITELVLRRGVAASVTFAGMLRGELKWSALRAAACYVLPSYSEGLSMALLEAMGVGVPVIATRACNMPEITAAETGWEIEPEVNVLTAALDEALRAPVELMEQKSRNGVRLIAEAYSPVFVAWQMAEVYGYVLGGPQPACVTAGERSAR